MFFPLLSLSLSTVEAMSTLQMYWTNFGANTIDGSNINQSFISATNGLKGVALDRDNQRIYRANFGRATIGRTDLDGGNVNQNFITSVVNPTFIALEVPDITVPVELSTFTVPSYTSGVLSTVADRV